MAAENISNLVANKPIHLAHPEIMVSQVFSNWCQTPDLIWEMQKTSLSPFYDKEMTWTNKQKKKKLIF